MTMYSEDGDELEFVGREESYTRGHFGTDGMERYSLGEVDSLYGLMPEGVDPVQYSDIDEQTEEYEFYVSISAYRVVGDSE